MIGWIILTILTCLAILWMFLCLTCDGKKEWGMFCFGIWALIMIGIGPTVVYYQDTISIPEHYIMLKETIQETKDLISGKELNLSDMEMHKELAGLIRERNELLKRVKVNNRSPWALFKIELE